MTRRSITRGHPPSAIRTFARGVLVSLSIAWVLTGCGGPDAEPPVESAVRQPRDVPTAGKKTTYSAARSKAARWLEGIEVDPVALAARGERGKKKLGEALEASLHLIRSSTDQDERRQLSERVRALAEQAARPEYHDLQGADPRSFNRDSMSYLRVAWLLEQLGQDSSDYRAQLESIRPRLTASLSQRAPTAHAQFQAYYDYFGWPLPEALQHADQKASVVARRLPVRRYQRASAYALAHEVSLAFRFAAAEGPDPFDDDARAYLRRVLPRLVIRFGASARADLDLVAELLAAMAWLDFRGLPAYLTGIQRLLRSQNADGSWGSWESQRASAGETVDVKYYLHTTMVVLRTLVQSAGPRHQSPSRGGSR